MLNEFLKSVVNPLMDDLGTPLAAKVKDLCARGEWATVISLRADPSHYTCPDLFFRDNQACELLRKCEDLPLPKGLRRRAAVELFHSSERQCHETNLRLRDFAENTALRGHSERVYAYVDRVKNLVKRCLGQLPKDLPSARFGPGATFHDKGALTTLLDKMSSRPSLTADAVWVTDYWRQTQWFRSLASERPNLSSPEIVRGNRFTTVPKDAAKDRGICVEPSLNLFYQLGVGAAIRTRLKRVRIDLDYGESAHKREASVASVFGTSATIDLSSASDTVSLELVRALLPADWYSLLSSLRCAYTRLDGRWYKLEKFSSMGNGFTFELETLLFLCLLWALDPDLLIPGENLFVYGDDIIIPSRYYEDAISVLRFFGFTPNPRKSFGSGPFRESCGGDFFYGKPVRAHYVKKIPTSPPEWISLANGFRRVVSNHNGGTFGLGPFHRAWLGCLHAIPSDLRRCRGPADLGDLVITDYEANWSVKWVDGIRYVRAVRPVYSKLPLHHWSPLTCLAGALIGVPSDGITPRGAVAGYKQSWIAYS